MAPLLREVEEPMLRQVDHDALVLDGRHDEAAGNGELGALPRQPHVDLGVRLLDLPVADAVLAGEVEQRIGGLRLDLLILSDERAAVRRQA